MPITEMNAWKMMPELAAQIKSLQDEIAANKEMIENYRQKRSARSVERK